MSRDDPASWTATQLKTKLLGARHDLVFLAGHFGSTSALAADFSTTVDTSDPRAPPPTSPTRSCSAPAAIPVTASSTRTPSPPGRRSTGRRRSPARGRRSSRAPATSTVTPTSCSTASRSTRTSPTSSSSATSPSRSARPSTLEKRSYLRHNALSPRHRHQGAARGDPVRPADAQRRPAHRIDPTNDASAVTATPVDTVPGSELGLRSATLTFDDDDNPLESHTKTLTGIGTANALASRYSLPSRIAASRSAGPAARQQNVTVPNQTLRGVGFIGATYTDSQVTPLTGAATEDIRGVHGTIESPVLPDAARPAQLLRRAPEGSTRLLITPAQHRGSGAIQSTLRRRRTSSTSCSTATTWRRSRAMTARRSARPRRDRRRSRHRRRREAGRGRHLDAHVVGDPSAG